MPQAELWPELRASGPRWDRLACSEAPHRTEEETGRAVKTSGRPDTQGLLTGR